MKVVFFAILEDSFCFEQDLAAFTIEHLEAVAVPMRFANFDRYYDFVKSVPFLKEKEQQVKEYMWKLIDQPNASPMEPFTLPSICYVLTAIAQS